MDLPSSRPRNDDRYDDRNNDRYDAVIVGGGIGGLVCAAYLAVAGRRVLVVEQHDVVGGSSQVFRRRRRYEFDVGVHYLGDCGPGGVLPTILACLGAAGRIGFRPMDQDGFDRLLLPGLSMDVPVGWDRYLANLQAALPSEAAALARCVGLLRTSAEELRRRLFGQVAAGAVRLPAAATRTLGELFADCGLSTLAVTLLSAQLGNYGSPPSATLVSTHVAMLDHYLQGAYYPQGGGQVLPATLVEVIEAHGGTVRTRCRVERIVVGEGRRVQGVLLAGGEQVRSPIVVSNADYRGTVLDLCGEQDFPASVQARTRAATSRAAVAVAYVALDRPLELLNANLWYWSGTDVEQCYARCMSEPESVAGRESGWRPPFAFLSFASLKDPDNPAVCPPGHSNFQVMTLIPPTGDEPTAGYRRHPGYLADKSTLTEGLIRTAEQLIGPFRSSITHLEAATARTSRRYIGSSSGSPFGLADWGGTGRRPDVRTSIEGLYVTGCSTRHQAGIAGTAISGIVAAGHILDRQLLPEAHRGAVLGDPGLLPERGSDFDALRVSRGRQRRDARGMAGLDVPQLTR